MVSSTHLNAIGKQRQKDDPDMSGAPDLGRASLFYKAVLHLFGKLVQAANNIHPPPLPRALLDKYMAELYRLHLWGDEFSASSTELDKHLTKSVKLHDSVLLILEQLSRALRFDLTQLLAPSLLPDDALDDALRKMDGLQKALCKTERASSEDSDCDDDESLTGSENLGLSGESILEDITTYVDCLMDLHDVLNSPALGGISRQKLVSEQLEEATDGSNDDAGVADTSNDTKNFCLKIKFDENNTHSQKDFGGGISGVTQPSSSHHHSISEEYSAPKVPRSGPPALGAADSKTVGSIMSAEIIEATVPTSMEDQAWMWVLDEGTIVVSFPQVFRLGKKELSQIGLNQSILGRLEWDGKNKIKSIYDLALVVFEACVNTPFGPTKTDGSSERAIDKYAEAISTLTNHHTTSFQHVRNWTQNASTAYRSKAKSTGRSQPDPLHVPLDISSDRKALYELRDIIDELQSIMDTQSRRRKVIKLFCKHVKDILGLEGSDKHGYISDQKFTTDLTRHHSDGRCTRAAREGFAISLDGKIVQFNRGQSPLVVDKQLMNSRSEERTKKPESRSQSQEEEEPRLDECLGGKPDGDHRRREQLDWFRVKSQQALSDLEDHIDGLEGLRKAADNTAKSINDLMGLKLQQFSVIEAWQSVKQAEEAVRQGRATRVFTITTFIFLPISFASSIFGMGGVDFGGTGDSMTLYEQLRYIAPVSSAVIFLSVVIAFNKLLRSFVWALLTYTWLLLKSQIYWILHKFGEEWYSGSTLVRKTAEEMVQRIRQDMEAIQNAQKRREGGGQTWRI
ncbi:hypothetical protein QBC44DRAFT_327351 [Cladorrhinum sp. PSN332]|nr:hypothetical protein QBC44DRAFT_327351 [Cladorrhinum sp. PSN332]